MALQQLKPSHYLSEQEYLAGELLSETKHEYIDGDVYAMTGTSVNHNRIVSNVLAALHPHLANTPCDLFAADMKVKTGPNFFYPDLIVDCQKNPGDAYYTESPLLIVEVLSKTTRKIDHTLKKLAYQNLPSIEEYVLVEQDFVDIQVCRRNNHWQSEHFFLGDTVYLASVELSLMVETIYARVDNEEMRAYFSAQTANNDV